MSSKKYPLNEKTLGDRLRSFRKSKKFNVTNFAKLLEISQGSLSDIENNKSNPSATPINNLVHKTDINIYWLFTGEGEMIRKIENKDGVAEGSPIYKVEKPDIDEPDHDDHEFKSKLIQTQGKLIQTQDKLISQMELIDQLKNRLAETEEKLKVSEEREARIRKEDEEAQREKLLKKRAV